MSPVTLGFEPEITKEFPNDESLYSITRLGCGDFSVWFIFEPGFVPVSDQPKSDNLNTAGDPKSSRTRI